MKQLAILFLLVAAMMGVTQTAAQAAGWRSADAQGWGVNRALAAADAENKAHQTLVRLARKDGEVCSNFSYTSWEIYQVPSGGGFQYGATATGLCG
jgi:hypothetical protein